MANPEEELASDFLATVREGVFGADSEENTEASSQED